jgi:hypothetical protein
MISKVVKPNIYSKVKREASQGLTCVWLTVTRAKQESRVIFLFLLFFHKEKIFTSFQKKNFEKKCIVAFMLSKKLAKGHFKGVS